MARRSRVADVFGALQSDIMIVAGTLTNKMAPALRKVYDQMPGTLSSFRGGLLTSRATADVCQPFRTSLGHLDGILR